MIEIRIDEIRTIGRLRKLTPITELWYWSHANRAYVEITWTRLMQKWARLGDEQPIAPGNVLAIIRWSKALPRKKRRKRVRNRDNHWRKHL